MDIVTEIFCTFKNFLCKNTPLEQNSNCAVPEACESQLLLKAALFVTRPAGLRLLWVGCFLVMKPHGVPACHNVISDDAAQRVRYYRHLPIFLKVWIP